MARRWSGVTRGRGPSSLGPTSGAPPVTALRDPSRSEDLWSPTPLSLTFADRSAVPPRSDREQRPMSGMWDHDEAGVFVETLFAKHHGEIYAYLLRMLRDPELAADLTQDAFIKAYKNYDTLEKPENARAWLYQIAHRVALDEIRRRKIVRFFPWTGESHGAAPSAEHLVMDAHLSGDMQRALARIPERQRAALLLAELHDLTGLELAAALGVSHVAARALLTRARESLRQALAAERAAEAEAEAKATTSPLGRGSPMSRAAAPPSATTAPADHPRARPGLAATRVDWPLEPDDAAWLDAHLASCDGVPLRRRRLRARTASRCAPCATSQPEPPRDLWARTAAAIERESASRSGSAREAASTDRRAIRPRRPVGRRGRRGRHRRERPVGRVPHRTVHGDAAGRRHPPSPSSTTRHARTPRRWRSVPVRSSGSGRRRTAGSPTTSTNDRRRSVRRIASPTANRSTTATRSRSTSRSGRSRSRSRRSRTRRSSSGPTQRASDVVVVIALADHRNRRRRPSATPTPAVDARHRRRTAEPTPQPPSASGRPASREPTRVRPPPSRSTPEHAADPGQPSRHPSRRRSRHRSSPRTDLVDRPTSPSSQGVKVVGQSAAYSPDGAWFAFTARPSDGSAGPGHLRLARRRPAGAAG